MPAVMPRSANQQFWLRYLHDVLMFELQEVIEQRESNSDSAPYTLLKNHADRFKKYSAEEQYEIDFQHRLANRNCYLDKYGDANINHYYRNLEIKHSQPKNRASGKRVS